jgi:hypothetical protein
VKGTKGRRRRRREEKRKKVKDLDLNLQFLSGTEIRVYSTKIDRGIMFWI